MESDTYANGENGDRHGADDRDVPVSLWFAPELLDGRGIDYAPGSRLVKRWLELNDELVRGLGIERSASEGRTVGSKSSWRRPRCRRHRTGDGVMFLSSGS